MRSLSVFAFVGALVLSSTATPQQAAAQTASHTRVPGWDGSWTRSASGGSEIEIPRFLADGPQRALLDNGVEFGTEFEGSARFPFSLRQYNATTSQSPHNWLRAGTKRVVTKVTYEVNKRAFGVVSGYTDANAKQGYYGICRRDGGRIECIDMFWETSEQAIAAPLINRIVRSFPH